MKTTTLAALAALALSISATSAQIIRPGMPRDGAGLSSEAQQTFRDNIGLAGLSASGGVLSYTGADAIFSGATATAPNAKSVITRERGDARWGSIESVQSRASLDYVQSDGATTARRIELVAPAAAINIAGADWTYVGEPVRIPTSNPSESAFFFGWVNSPTAQPNVQDNALSVSINSSGDLTIFQDKDGGDHRTLTYSGFRAAYSGQEVRLIIAFSGDSPTAPTVWANGTDISSNFVLSTSEPPNWVHTALTSDYFVQGYNWPAGPFRPGRAVLLRRYVQADVDYVQRTGNVPPVDRRGTMVVPLSPALNGSTGGSRAYPSFSGATASGFTAGNAASFACLAGFDLPALSPGAIVRVRFSFDQNTALVPPTVRLVRSREDIGSEVYISNNVSAAAGTNEVTLVTTAASRASGAFLGFRSPVSNTGTFIVSNVVVSISGALADPIIQPILALDDATSNGFQSRMIGFESVTPRKDWRLVARTATNGNAQLLGGAIFRDANRHRIDSIVVRNAGSSRTISIGNASGGSQYVSSATAAAGLSDHTPATRFNGTENIWIASDGTDELTTTITGHRVQ